MVMLDWIAVALLGLSALAGGSRGLLFEVISLIGWIAAFVLTPWLAADVGRWLPFGAPDAPWRGAVGVVLVFVAVVFAAGLIAALVRRLLCAVGMRPADRMLGSVFGLARGALVLLALGLAVRWLGLGNDGWWRESTSATVVDAALQRAKPMLPEKLASYL